MRTRVIFASTATTLMILLAAGCQGGDPVDHAQDQAVGAASGAAAGEAYPLDRVFSFVSYKYSHHEHPRGLTSYSDLIVAGTVAGWEQGPAHFPEDPYPIKNVILTVKTDRVAMGQAEQARVLLPQGPPEVADVAASLPVGTRVVLYLTPVTAEMRAELGPEAVGDDLWVPSSPQGFVVEDPRNGALVFPMDPELGSTVPRGMTLLGMMPKNG